MVRGRSPNARAGFERPWARGTWSWLQRAPSARLTPGIPLSCMTKQEEGDARKPEEAAQRLLNSRDALCGSAR